MGQKTILNTLRLNHQNYNLNSNLKNNLNLSILKSLLNKIFIAKNFILDKDFLTYNESILIYNIKFFICSQPFSKYKKKFIKQNFISKQLNIIVKIIKNNFKILKINLLKFKIQILNIYINHELLLKLYYIFKIYINLFEKRFYVFVDFLKIATLFALKKVTIQSLLLILSKIFARLHKRKHSKFLVLAQTLFNFYVMKSYFKGFKLIINGKFGGKTMSSTNSLISGSISIQSLKKNIDYSKIHSYTSYGVYGLKLWVYN